MTNQMSYAADHKSAIIKTFEKYKWNCKYLCELIKKINFSFFQIITKKKKKSWPKKPNANYLLSLSLGSYQIWTEKIQNYCLPLSKFLQIDQIIFGLNKMFVKNLAPTNENDKLEYFEQINSLFQFSMVIWIIVQISASKIHSQLCCQWN